MAVKPLGVKMKKASLSNTVLVALGVLSWSATAAGFFKLAVGNSDLRVSTVGIDVTHAKNAFLGDF